ncbi:MAG: hypothetical protein IPK80_00220 [Nannocystis sp.]|nr:hypothetical protein [Nannocystis sp.]
MPALRLGDVTLHDLLASVCDGCCQRPNGGLLRLNARSAGSSCADNSPARMPRPAHDPARPNRAYDINPAVQLDIEGARRSGSGRVRWVVVI